jgi:hypothetical protein
MVVMGVFLLAIAILLLPPPDGLNWVRAYGMREIHRNKSKFFYFDGQVPAGLEDEILRRLSEDVEFEEPGLIEGVLKDGWGVDFNVKRGDVSFYHWDERTWLEERWGAFKRLFGLGP